MPCYKPLNAARFKTNKSKIWFLKSGNPIPRNAEYLRLPCGQCTGCRLDRSRHWATRLMHEAKQHDQSSFITLTYSDENLPPDSGLRLSDFQKFMKRLRKHVKKPIKFYHCGEYGSPENSQRPHYHSCIFGWDPIDKELLTMRGGHSLYTSDTLGKLWNLGYSSVAEVSWQSAAYVARYCMKKINGPKAEQVDPVTGLRPYDRVHAWYPEIVEVPKEYSTMSNGLGKKHFNEFKDDIYPHDEVIVNGYPSKPPRYYDKLYELVDPDSMDEIKERRISVMENYLHDNTRSRLKTKEKVKGVQINQLQRQL